MSYGVDAINVCFYRVMSEILRNLSQRSRDSTRMRSYPGMTMDDMSQRVIESSNQDPEDGEDAVPIPRRRCRLAFVSNESQAPPSYKWPEWWRRPGCTSRIYLTGDTGSGKTTLVNTLLSTGLRGPPIPFDTCYWVTDKPKYLANSRFAQDILNNKYMKQIAPRKKVRSMHYNEGNPNYKLRLMSGTEFKDVALRDIQTRPLGKKGPYNHTLIVLDDVNLKDRRNTGKHSTLGYMLSQGREFGISLIYITQGIVTDVEDGITLDQRGQFDTLIITGKIRRTGYNRDIP